MNIGEIKKNASGQLIGTVETLTMTRTIGLRPVSSSNARAPKYEIVALNDQRRWVAVGASAKAGKSSPTAVGRRPVSMRSRMLSALPNSALANCW